MSYSSTADKLANRIYKLMEEDPTIYFITDPWKLFSVEGFKCDDLEPSLYQAGWALGKAKSMYDNKLNTGG